MPAHPNKPLLRVDEAAEYWSVTPRTIYLWIEHGHLELVRTPGGQLRLTRESVLQCRIAKENADGRER